MSTESLWSQQRNILKNVSATGKLNEKARSEGLLTFEKRFVIAWEFIRKTVIKLRDVDLFVYLYSL